MEKESINSILANAVATYIKSLEDVVKEDKKKISELQLVLKSFEQKIITLNTEIRRKDKDLEQMKEEAHKSQDADVIVGAITGNVPRETWESLVLAYRNGIPIKFGTQAFENCIKSELAELIERSLEYKWGR